MHDASTLVYKPWLTQNWLLMYEKHLLYRVKVYCYGHSTATVVTLYLMDREIGRLWKKAATIMYHYTYTVHLTLIN